MYPADFVRTRLEVARRLARGECGGSAAEAILITSSALSTLAADLWPGEQIDRKRFVELWVRYADPALNSTRVSVPLLAEACHVKGPAGGVGELEKLCPEVVGFFPSMPDSLVLDGDRADRDESDVKRACPSIPLPMIRKHSYPALFYEHIRSGVVHEYSPTKFASIFPGGSRDTPISYSNVIERPFRRIYFKLDWVFKVASSIASNAEPDIRARNRLPHVWWLAGA